MLHRLWPAGLLAVARLASATPLAGTTVDPQGAPLPGVEVTCALAGQVATTTSDAAGRWQLEAPGEGAVLLAHKADWLGVRQTAGTTLRLSPLPPGTLQGRVVRPVGRRLGGQSVHLRRARLPFSFDEDHDATTDEAGWFVAHGLPAGLYAYGVDRDDQTHLYHGQWGLMQLPTLDYDPRRPPTLTLRGSSRGNGWLRLRAVDDDDVPAPGARVTLRLANGLHEAAPTGKLLHGQVVSHGPVPPLTREWGRFSVWTLLSDDQGEVELALAPGVSALRAGKRGEWGWYFVRDGETLGPLTVRAEGRPAKRTTEPPELAGTPREFADVTCRVVDAAGRPLAGQVVYLNASEGDATGCGFCCPADHLSQCWRRTDAEGQAVLERRPVGALTVVAKAAGYASSAPIRLTVARGGPNRCTLTLAAPPVRARGRVVDAQGAPAAGVWVLADQCTESTPTDLARAWVDLRYGASYECGCGGPNGRPLAAGETGAPGEVAGLLRAGLYYTRTAADGSFAFDQLDGGRWDFLAGDARGYHGALADQAPGDALRLVLAPPTRLCLALRTADGTWAADRAVNLEAGGWHVEGRTDAAGELWVSEPPVGPAKLSAPFGGRREARDVTIVAGQDNRVLWPLPAETIVTGEVRGPDGRPVAGALVAGRASAPTPPEQPAGASTARGELPRAVWTDAAGRFRLDRVRDPAAGVLVLAPGLAARVVWPPFPLVIQLSPGVALRGQVQTPDGRPVNYPTVRAVRCGDGPELPDWFGTVGDESGQFILWPLRVGPVQLAVGVGRDSWQAPTERPERITLTANGGPLTLVVPASLTREW